MVTSSEAIERNVLPALPKPNNISAPAEEVHLMLTPYAPVRTALTIKICRVYYDFTKGTCLYVQISFLGADFYFATVSAVCSKSLKAL